MNQLIAIHPDNPQQRLLNQAADALRAGGVIVYPTDSGYALGCHLGDKHAVERIRKIRQLDPKHNFTLMCSDLSELSVYAKVDNVAYRILRSHTPGPYTFVLPASSEVPKRLKHPKRKTIGLRVPQNNITQGLLAALAEPIMSVTMILPGEDLPMLDAYEIQQAIGHQVELIIDGGFCGFEATSIIDLSEEMPQIIRRGAGSVEAFE